MDRFAEMDENAQDGALWDFLMASIAVLRAAQ